MKYFNPFAQYCVTRYFDDKFTIGIEVEFLADQKYFTNCSNSGSIFGIDGAGKPTGEYRSPIFKSTVPSVAFNGMIRFTNTTLKYLKNNFNVVFIPYVFRSRKDPFYGNRFIPLGVHFSVGGKFLSDISSMIERGSTIQELLIDRIDNKDAYLDREKFYPGKFTKLDGVPNIDGNAFKLKDFSGDKSYSYTYTKIVEFRFFPSAIFETLVPYIRYCVLGGSIPTNEILTEKDTGEIYKYG